ncbi:MAG: DUF541 domain-containing protein [Chloroflexi bacterium]|nr:MAG: DUF541 domain-containing protein [Chloroflexota bacterium]
MKQFSTFVNFILAALVVFLLLSANLPAARAQATAPGATASPTIAQPACDSSRTVQVTGAATINVVPDRALVQLGVQSNGATPELVQAANSIAIQKVIKALSAQGILAKDIATDLYIIEPVYENYDSLYIKGYRINNVVAVTLRDVKKVSSVLAAALGAGANQVVNVEFYTSDLRKYRDQARELATKAAREKAQALASAAGAEAGCVLNINENSWSYYNGWWYGRSQNQWTQNVVQNAAPGAGMGSSVGDEPISLGQISVKAEISATFGLK